MSTLNVDKVDPSTGTALEIGSSGDTITVPSGATLTTTSATLNLPTTITATTEVKTNKISPATGTAFTLGDSGDTFTVPSGATIANSGTATGFGITSASFLPYANPVLINGNMAVAQRGTSVAGTTSGGYLTVDRYDFRVNTAGTWTMTQEALSADEAYEDGFSTAAKMDCTTADASLGAGDYIRFHYAVEAQDCQLFKLGNSGSDTLTLAFWVKATKTGTNVATMIQTDPDRMCCQSYTVDATDTWEHKVLNFPADTAGAGINNDNGEGLEIDFHMAAGSSFTSGTLQTTWAARVNADRAVGQVNHADSTSNNFHITGIQLEAGTYTSADLPPFRHESYGDNLRRCQRYYYMLDPLLHGNNPIGMGSFYSTTTIYCTFDHKVNMRAEPTGDLVTGTSYFNINAESANKTFDTISYSGNTTTGNLYGTGLTSTTEGVSGRVRFNNSAARIAADAEL